MGSVFRSVDGRGFLIEVPEEIIEGLVDFDVHVDHGIHLNGIHFDVEAAAQTGGKEADEAEA
jgi:hypothetical protein